MLALSCLFAALMVLFSPTPRWPYVSAAKPSSTPRKTSLRTSCSIAGPETASVAEPADGERATLEVIANAVLEIGLDRLSPDLPVHINYPRDAAGEAGGAPGLPPTRRHRSTGNRARRCGRALAGIVALKAKGHQIALDDFSPAVTDMKLLEHADIVKLDLSQHTPEAFEELATAAQETGRAADRRTGRDDRGVRSLCGAGIRRLPGLLPAASEDRSVRARSSANRLGALRIVSLLQKEDLEVSDIERLVAHDLGLSYRVLRCINSSYYGFSKKVDSIRQAGDDPRLRALAPARARWSRSASWATGREACSWTR